MQLKDLLTWIEEDFTGEDLEAAKAVASDMAMLLAHKAAGKDVDAELAHVAAAAANLSATAAAKVRQTFLEWSGELAREVLVGVLSS